jgi:hypothetical protein
MRILYAILLVVLLTGSTVLAASIVCDPQVGVTNYTLTGPAWVPRSITAEPDGSLVLDITHGDVGFNMITVKACDAAKCSSSESLILGIQKGTFKSGNSNVVWKEWWIVGR